MKKLLLIGLFFLGACEDLPCTYGTKGVQKINSYEVLLECVEYKCNINKTCLGWVMVNGSVVHYGKNSSYVIPTGEPQMKP